MSWQWDQSAGELRRDGQLVSRGYSGHGRGKNNPALQAAAGIGPIPVGRWTIVRVYDSDRVGPYALELAPKPGTQTFNRSAFRIHGDSIANPGTASHGCMILPRKIRELIWRSGDRDLEVTT